MFKYFLIAALVACVYANAEDAHAEIKSLESDVGPEGFHYSLETTNHIASKASGDEHGNVHGEFEWVSPEGEHIKITYVSDENGYQPSGDVLPTSPPVPEGILKSLEYNNAHPYVEDSHHH